ncbi:glycosylated lysosomal membrane protein [Spea bombifrons]|uniref:glycosylated lysosomal membrane protein n=1 Tax=Spea bombifrons TaxID=233779 RepID=UPI00234BB31F|nr:glycosylated lysosomal membrane protein [Spea bombifrons]
MPEGIWLTALGALCAVLGVLGEPEEPGRKVSLHYNPGFHNTSVNLLHVRAVDNSSTIHYVWSTIGAPTVLLIYTSNAHSELHVNWTKLLSPSPHGAISIEPADSVLYATALLFNRIFEYWDVNNTADFSGTDGKYFYPAYNLSDFHWENTNATLNSSSLTANLTGRSISDPAESFQNGSVTFRVSAYGSSGRDLASPRLLHNANCSKLEFLLSGVNPRGNNSRFAMEMVALEKKDGRKKIESVRSIDDEYTPTVFEVAQLLPDTPNASHALGYLQWKSVAYGSTNGKREEAHPCRFYTLRGVNGTLEVPSIVHAFFGEDLTERYNVEAFNISFGVADGDFYVKHKFLSWSSLIGYGTPPKDSFSTLVICIMAVALGTPLGLLILGAIVVATLKNRVYSNYEPIN